MAASGVAQFTVGSVLSRGYAVLARNIVPFGLMSVVVNSPYFLYDFGYPEALSGAGADEVGVTQGLVLPAALILLSVVVYGVLTAALSYGTFQELRGRHAGLGDCVSRGLAVMLPVLGVVIVAGICIVLGFLALFVPGLFLTVALWVVIPVAVVERPGILASLGRSWRLTGGYRWPILGIVVIVAALQFLASLLLSVVVGLAGETSSIVGEWLITAYFGALYAVVATVGYHDLRAVKEGVGIEEIASVFD